MKTELTPEEYEYAVWVRQYTKHTQKITTVNRVENTRTTYPRDCTLIQVYDPYKEWPYQFTYYKLTREKRQ